MRRQYTAVYHGQCLVPHYRDAARWAPLPTAALAVETDPQVRAAIEAALGRTRG